MDCRNVGQSEQQWSDCVAYHDPVPVDSDSNDDDDYALVLIPYIVLLNVAGEKCRDPKLSGYTGKERRRESWCELLPWTWRESGLCLGNHLPELQSVNNNSEILFSLIYYFAGVCIYKTSANNV
jgi:hypothetical protein